jgi:hypothetical protein
MRQLITDYFAKIGKTLAVMLLMVAGGAVGRLLGHYFELGNDAFMYVQLGAAVVVLLAVGAVVDWRTLLKR